MPILFEGPELAAQYWEPVAQGPVAQADLSTWAGLSAAGPPAATLGAAGTYQSGVIPAPGWKGIAIGVKSSQTGAITIQRFMDKAGLVPVGAPITASLVANTANWVNVDDGVPYQSFSFSITNTGGATANLSNFCCLLNAA
jgi:hypothetical protein